MVTESINFGSDIKNALQMAFKNDLRPILKQTLYTESIDGLKSIPVNAKQTAKRVSDFAIQVAATRDLPKKETIQKHTTTLFNKVKKLPREVSIKSKVKAAEVHAFYNSLETNEDKALVILELTTYAFSTAAGVYLGGGTPDCDISALGIAKHRHYAFHSALPAIAITKLAKVLARLFDAAEGYMPPDPHPHDVRLLQFTKKNLELIAFGYSIGVAQHLFVDGTIENTKAVVSPWGNTFVKGTILDDNAYLCVNAAESLRQGISVFKSDIAPRPNAMVYCDHGNNHC